MWSEHLQVISKGMSKEMLIVILLRRAVVKNCRGVIWYWVTTYWNEIQMWSDAQGKKKQSSLRTLSNGLLANKYHRGWDTGVTRLFCDKVSQKFSIDQNQQMQYLEFLERKKHKTLCSWTCVLVLWMPCTVLVSWASKRVFWNWRGIRDGKEVW